jgi:hypothetical protein
MVAVDRWATVQPIPVLEDRGLPQKPRQVSGNETQEIEGLGSAMKLHGHKRVPKWSLGTRGDGILLLPSTLVEPFATTA